MIIIPAILDSYRSLKDRTLKITFETNEPTPDQLKDIGLGVQKFGFLAFRVGEKEGELQSIMEQIPNVDIEFGKTKSQRLRGVLYRLWEQSNEGYEVFDDFYNNRMEKLITDIKNRLD
jgi:hypothetical protein